MIKRYEIRNSSGKFYFSFSVSMDGKETRVLCRRMKDLNSGEISLMEDIISHLSLVAAINWSLDDWVLEQKTKFDILTNNWVL